MSRRQAARRLGKSLTTIRRIEGVLLHPDVDSRGVHRFREEDVDRLADDVEHGRLVLGQQLRPLGNEVLMNDHGTTGFCQRCSDLQQELDRVQRQLEAQVSAHRRELTRMKAERDRERADQDAAARDLVDQVTELMAALEG